MVCCSHQYSTLFIAEVKARFHRVRFPSYLIVLLCLHVWEKRLSDTKYDILACFFKVLEEIEKKEDLNVVWAEKYYEQHGPQNITNSMGRRSSWSSDP